MSTPDRSPDPLGDDLLDEVTVGADDEVLAQIRAQLQAREDTPSSESEPVASDVPADGFEPDDDPTIGAVELPEVLRQRGSVEPPASPTPSGQAPPQGQAPRGQAPRMQAPQGRAWPGGPQGQASQGQAPQMPAPQMPAPRMQPPQMPAPPTGPGMSGPEAAPRPAPGPQLPLPEESTTLGWQPPERSTQSRNPGPAAKPPSRTWLVPLIAAVVVAAIVAVVVLL